MRYTFLIAALGFITISSGQTKNRAKDSDAKIDIELKAELEKIYDDDQAIRTKYINMQKASEFDNPELKQLGVQMNTIDSINTIKVLNILDTRGWVGSDVVGTKGNQALFLVLQHADIATQKKYVPLMREAAENKDASYASLALLEDRIEIREGLHQIYGSQISRHPITNEFYVLPLIDPDNVDTRRATRNLGPLAEYVENWKIIWDPAKYKLALPEYEKILSERK